LGLLCDFFFHIFLFWESKMYINGDIITLQKNLILKRKISNEHQSHNLIGVDTFELITRWRGIIVSPI